MQLGLELELVQTEKPVGGPPYYCDILARETNKDVLVAIENQLEWTDFSHLAQTLIYTRWTQGEYCDMGRGRVQV